MQRWRSWLAEIVRRLLQPPAAAASEGEPVPEPPALAYIEKTLADAYRKEIDQEENVWRSLPFFAATLALQVTALVQIIDRFPNPATILGHVSNGLLGLAALLDLIALGFLCLSIWPRQFRYLASEPDLLDYAQELIRDEGAGKDDASQIKPESALTTLKWELARQYAVGANHNRQINKGRERWRNRAGLAIVFSVLVEPLESALSVVALPLVLVTFFLVAATYGPYLYDQLRRDTGNAAVHAPIPTPVQPRSRSRQAGPDQGGNAVKSKSSPAAAHAGGG